MNDINVDVSIYRSVTRALDCVCTSAHQRRIKRLIWMIEWMYEKNYISALKSLQMLYNLSQAFIKYRSEATNTVFAFMHLSSDGNHVWRRDCFNAIKVALEWFLPMTAAAWLVCVRWVTLAQYRLKQRTVLGFVVWLGHLSCLATWCWWLGCVCDVVDCM